MRRFEPAEDLDLWLRLAKAGDLANLNEVVLLYRRHATAVTAVRAEANARAAALALLHHRHGLDVAMPDGEEPCWGVVERSLAPAYRLVGRAAYLRALAVNGGITRVPAACDLLRQSLPLFTADPLAGSDRDVLAFMVTRAAWQLMAVGAAGRAASLVRDGLRHLPGETMREAVAGLLRRMPARQLQV
jgi:hypothetical protein